MLLGIAIGEESIRVNKELVTSVLSVVTYAGKHLLIAETVEDISLELSIEIYLALEISSK